MIVNSKFKAPFVGFGNKLSKLCTRFRKDCENMELRRNNLCKRIAAKLENRGMKSFRDIMPDKVFHSIFMMWKGNNADDRKDMFIGFIDFGRMLNFSARFKGQNGTGQGVVRTMFQKLVDDISTMGLFCRAEERSDVFVINPDFVYPDAFKTEDIRGTEEDVQELYEFVGGICVFCLLNQLGLGFFISRAIALLMLVSPEKIDPDEYVVIFLSEHPSEMNSVMSLLEHPEHIDHLNLNFNDYFKLHKHDDPLVTTSNFRAYIQAKAKHQLLHQHRVGAFDTYGRLKALCKGFSLSKRLLAATHIDTPLLYNALCGESITFASIAHWIGSITFSVPNDKINKWFVEILRDEGKTFPWEGDAPSTLEARKQGFLDFVKRLLWFWSGLSQIVKGQPYKVSIITRAYPTNPSADPQAVPVTHLPVSHTCFYIIDIPNDVRDKADLYKRLVMASSFVENGMGLAGGARR